MAKKKGKVQQENYHESKSIPVKKATISLDSVVFPPLTRKHNLALNEIEPDKIILIPNAFDEGECKQFIKFIDSLPLELTPAPKKGEALRVNHRVVIPSSTFSQALFAYLSPHLPKFPFPASRVVRIPGPGAQNTDAITARPAHGFNSQIRLYKYTEGQHFGCHYDDSVTDPVTGAHSEWTLLIYLSGKEDGVVGGETIFYRSAGKRKDKDPPIKPELCRGMALLHRHGHECLFHEGALVQKGVKYVLRTDVMFLD